MGLPIFDEFFKKKVTEYVVPHREGTPKGEPIGFSSKKYAASLFMLTSVKLKELAGALKVSYGLLRVWRTEEEFKKQIEQNYQDFSDYFERILWDKFKIMELNPDEIIQLVNNLEAEGKFYAARLYNLAMEKLADTFERIFLSENVFEKDKGLGVLMYLQELWGGKKLLRQFADLLLLNIVKNILEGRWIPEEEPKKELIKLIERFFERKVKEMKSE